MPIATEMNNLPAACSLISRNAAGTIDGLTATNTTSALRTTVPLSVVEFAPSFWKDYDLSGTDDSTLNVNWSNMKKPLP